MSQSANLWVKLRVDFFEENDAFDILERRHPDKADAVTYLWMRMVTHAGKSNAEGQLLVNGLVPMDRDDIADKFNRPKEIVDWTVDYLKKYGLVIEEHGAIEVADWYTYVNVDVMADIREKNRIKTANWRERKKSKETEPKSDAPVTTGDVSGDVTRDPKSKTKKETKKEKEDNRGPAPFGEIIDYLNEVCKKSFRRTKSHDESIRARWSDGYTIEDFKAVIDYKRDEWYDAPRAKNGQMPRSWLRPSTLFSNKFDNYLNESKESQREGGTGRAEREQGDSGSEDVTALIRG